MELEPTGDRLAAVLSCDPAADGRFWYAVTTTRIYCRPSCRSRTPRAERIRLFVSPEAAEAAGFRPCKRCRPDSALDPDGETAACLDRAREYLRERCLEPVSWRDAASRAFLSPSRFHRLFRARYGVPPAAYVTRCRLEAGCALLARTDRSVLQVAAEAGFGSPAAFYRAFRSATGTTPARFRQGLQGDPR
jgi:AraC family transcriptional regulator of adaptative response / methylphosphotriester-DNA alkyltransferase methyltransferase